MESDESPYVFKTKKMCAIIKLDLQPNPTAIQVRSTVVSLAFQIVMDYAFQIVLDYVFQI